MVVRDALVPATVDFKFVLRGRFLRELYMSRLALQLSDIIIS